MNSWWYPISVFIHIVCAVTWAGGMLFIVMVLAPLLRSADFRPVATRVLHVTGKKFKKIGWACLLLLLVTGTLNARARYGYPGQPWGEWGAVLLGNRVLMEKVSAFGVILVLSWLHDFHIGPAAVRAMRSAADAPGTLRLRRAAAWMGRVNLLLALTIVWWALKLVRG
jgi:uncharacterized membrane protein